VRVNGPLYFGAASYVQQALQQIDEDNPLQKSVLIAAASLSYIDVAGAEVLAQEARRRRRLGGGLYFYRLSQALQGFLKQGGYAGAIGEGAFFPVMTNVTGALYWTLDPDVCRSCKTRIFTECRGKLLPDGLRRQRLLLATDGSEFSRAPTEIAIALARSFGVTLDIMTAVDAAAGQDVAHARIAPVVRQAMVAGVDCEEIVRQGKQPVREIVSAAAAAGTNILIIGRRPAREVRNRLLGDAAGQVIGSAPCHVLVAGAQAGMWHKRILLACDGGALDDSITELGTQIARITGMPVTIVSAIANDRQRAEATADAERAAALMRLDGVDCNTRIVSAAPAQAIIKAAAELNVDLVVIGHHRGKGLNRVIAGSTTDRVIGTLKCAVLVVRAPLHGADIETAIAKQS
jgi:SulP family sulfate permease